MFVNAKPQFSCFVPIDLKLADIYIRDGYSNLTSTPTTSAIEPVGETTILLGGMASAVPDPSVTTGVSVKFGSDLQEYTVTARTLGSATNEVQTIEIDANVSGGTFTLTFGAQTTNTIAYNAANTVVEAELEALSTVGLGNVAVTGTSPVWTVTFQGDLAGTDVGAISGTGALLTGGAPTTVNVTETTAGVTAVDEVQTLTATVALTVGTYTLTFLGDTTSAIEWDATPAEIEFALESLDSVPQGEATVSVNSGTWPQIASALDVTFSGTLGGTNHALIIVGEGSLTGDITVTEDTAGVVGVAEVNTININSSTSGGTFTLTQNANTTAPILYSATAAEVQAALVAAPTSLVVTVTGGPGPGTNWVVTYTSTGAQTAITGTGTNLTGGSATNVAITETTKGVAATSTTSVTVTPGLVIATAAGGSVTFGGRKLEIKVGEGNLSFTENTPREYIKNRGNLDTVRDADEEPLDATFDFTWEFLSAVTNSGLPTIKEALKKIGEASTWVSTSLNECESYACNIEVYYDPACGNVNTETIELKYFRVESLEHNVRDAQLTCTGKCNTTAAVETRGL